VHGQQDEPFLIAGEPRHRGFVRQVALQDPLLHQAAALVVVRLQRPDHCLRVGVDALALEQHRTAERQPAFRLYVSLLCLGKGPSS